MIYKATFVTSLCQLFLSSFLFCSMIKCFGFFFVLQVLRKEKTLREEELEEVPFFFFFNCTRLYTGLVFFLFCFFLSWVCLDNLFDYVWAFLIVLFHGSSMLFW